MSTHTRDRVRQLRVFCTAARLGGAARAAEHLGLTQPAVSLQVRELEHELGAELFERGPSGMSLTPAGERLEALAGPLIGTVEALFGDFRRVLDEMDSGQLRLSVSNIGAAFVLPPYIKSFLDRYPDMTVRLDTVSFREGHRRLLEAKVDLMLGPRDLDPDRHFRYRELFAYERVLITALDHPLAGRGSVSLHEAAAYRAVAPPAGNYSRQIVEKAARALGIDIGVAVEVDGWGMLKRYVEAGIGVSVVPSLCLSDSDQLSVVALDADFAPNSYGVFTLRGRLLTATARRFLEVLVPDLSGANRDSSATPDAS